MQSLMLLLAVSAALPVQAPRSFTVTHHFSVPRAATMWIPLPANDPWQRVTDFPHYTYSDLASITAPTLILCGDRDEFCPVEQAVAAYRQLPDGELAILPGHGHYIPPAAVETTIEFLERRAGARAWR